MRKRLNKFFPLSQKTKTKKKQLDLLLIFRWCWRSNLQPQRNWEKKKEKECGMAASGLFPLLVSRGSRLKHPQTKRCTDYMSEASQRRNYFPQLDLNTHPPPYSPLPDPTITPLCPAVEPKVKVLAADSQVSKRLYKSVGSVLSILATRREVTEASRLFVNRQVGLGWWRERDREREGECMWGIIPSHKPPFDTTRWVLVSLNNPCCSIKFADEIPQDHVSELKGPEREEQGTVFNGEPSERNEMGGKVGELRSDQIKCYY